MSLLNTNKKGDLPSNIDRTMKVFEEHGHFIRSIIDFNVRDEAEAEDIFQDFFLFLILKPMPNEIQNIRAFLYRMVSGKIKDAFRRIDRYRARIRRYAGYSRHITEYRPKNNLIEAEETKRMFELIEKHLPPKEALAVTLRYRDNCDTVKVAQKMGVQPRSISRYVSMGLKKARHFFGVNER